MLYLAIQRLANLVASLAVTFYIKSEAISSHFGGFFIIERELLQISQQQQFPGWFLIIWRTQIHGWKLYSNLHQIGIGRHIREPHYLQLHDVDGVDDQEGESSSFCASASALFTSFFMVFFSSQYKHVRGSPSKGSKWFLLWWHSLLNPL